MESCVFEYPKWNDPKRRKARLTESIVGGVFWAAGMLLFRVWHARSVGTPPEWIFETFNFTIGASLFGILTYFYPTTSPWTKKGRSTRNWLVVSAGGVSVMAGSEDPATWTRRTTVRKDKIKSVFRVPSGIGIAEHSQFAARMWRGFIVLPESIPNFAALKLEVESWKNSPSA